MSSTISEQSLNDLLAFLMSFCFTEVEQSKKTADQNDVEIVSKCEDDTSNDGGGHGNDEDRSVSKLEFATEKYGTTHNWPIIMNTPNTIAILVTSPISTLYWILRNMKNKP